MGTAAQRGMCVVILGTDGRCRPWECCCSALGENESSNTHEHPSARHCFGVPWHAAVCSRLGNHHHLRPAHLDPVLQALAIPVSSLLCHATEPGRREWGRSRLLALPAPSCLRPSQKNGFGNSRRSDTDPLSFTTPSAFDVNTEFMRWADTEKSH